ncbi:NADH-quinone oxidoreductase subunit N [Thermoflavimicrobium daqui]|uniref:NADH-quinone oxidoreductase subunit N n=1 Tax=Thermoflavimicrobium daqui TaxID=2137476 RepID=A0A364K5G1_9BACL|nr:NADH-quinone oxidoreductase subunit N [Thermoflavimicrobium daqui]RAL24592.1 NADH-quinone oxidoreductase subunit N [Thermoflavimicrobium daqui]
MQQVTEIDWDILAPELIIMIACALLVILDLVLPSMISRRWIGLFSLVAVVTAGVWIVTQFGHSPVALLENTYRLTPVTLIWKLILLSGTFLVLLISLGEDQEEFAPNSGEYYYLLLAAVLGGMFMVSSADLITLYVGLELFSLSSYVLVGIRKRRGDSNEAAWKYVVLGGMSSAFILYGMSFLYGLSGSTNLANIQQYIVKAQGTYDWIIYLSFFLMIVGFGFKLASAPFHTWVPDVYQGAATPITSFLSVVSKSLAFALLFIMIGVFDGIDEGWESIFLPTLMIMAALSMIIGNTAALRQKNMKRLMAYSSIAQAGYILIPIATLNKLYFPSTFFYLFVYLFMTIGAFAVIMLVMRQEKNEDMKAFAGLHQRSPWLALAMTIFLISLAGIPLTAGFFGKMLIIMGALGMEHLWLIVIMVITTIVSYYYYFSIIRQMYFRKANTTRRIRTSWPIGIAISMSAIATIGFGVFPEWILNLVESLLFK